MQMKAPRVEVPESGGAQGGPPADFLITIQPAQKPLYTFNYYSLWVCGGNPRRASVSDVQRPGN